MPRNACSECRRRKIRCQTTGTAGKCRQCQVPNVSCSYVQATNTTYRAASPPHTITPPPGPNIGSGRLFTLASVNSGLDIGTGTPSELLREGELTQTLLLLYFQNFNDVQSPSLRAHWGEPLYHQARQFLKEEFDHPSITTIQAYILLATYNLTFGGTRKAWIYLNSAYCFMKLLRLDYQPAGDMDPVQEELCRRLIATIALMKNTFPADPYLARSIPPIHPLPRIYSEEGFDMIKIGGVVTGSEQHMPCATQVILSLSEMYYEAYQLFPESSTEEHVVLQRKLSSWAINLLESLAFNSANIATHQERFTIRPLSYMHMLHAHIWQIIFFDSMEWSSVVLTDATCTFTATATGPNTSFRILPIYKYASDIANIVHKLWAVAQIDIHNSCFGQIIKTAQVILTHHLLSTSDVHTALALQGQIIILRDCIVRLKGYCRLYNWVFDQAEWFLRICTQDPSPWDDPQKWRSMLHFHVISLGTSYERLDYQTAGRASGLESLASVESHEQHRNNQIPEILLPAFVAQRLGRN
ncbi:hypothetical protein BJX64DRAFT_270732 [Aspergillus heterothallicus]